MQGVPPAQQSPEQFFARRLTDRWEASGLAAGFFVKIKQRLGDQQKILFPRAGRKRMPAANREGKYPTGKRALAIVVKSR